MADFPTSRLALALGSNIGDRLAALQAAVQAVGDYIKIEAISSVYETAPAYVSDQPVFLNAVLVGETTVSPLALLWTVKDIESEIGRQPTYRFGPRVIDIDIIFYGDVVMKAPELTIPHAFMQERDFVLRPLSEIAPDWQHPELKKAVAELLAELPDSNIKCLGKIL